MIVTQQDACRWLAEMRPNRYSNRAVLRRFRRRFRRGIWDSRP